MTSLNLAPFKSMFGPISMWDEDTSLMSSLANSGLDVYETENDIVVKANVAGVPAQDIEVNFEKGVLWIQARATDNDSTDTKDEQKYYSRASWEYSYKVTVPGLIDHSQEPQVKLKDGVLVVIFKKSEAYKPKKLTVEAE